MKAINEMTDAKLSNNYAEEFVENHMGSIDVQEGSPFNKRQVMANATQEVSMKDTNNPQFGFSSIPEHDAALSSEKNCNGCYGTVNSHTYHEKQEERNAK